MGRNSFIYLFFKSEPEDKFTDERERERERERNMDVNINVREKHQSVVSGMLSDWASNLQPFGVRDDAPSN